jgi:hypothetical protein
VTPKCEQQHTQKLKQVFFNMNVDEEDPKILSDQFDLNSQRFENESQKQFKVFKE